MRMAFGLVSLLVTVAIICYLMVGGGGTGGPGYLQQVSQTNKQLKGQVNVLSGFDPSRQILATDSMKYRIDRTTGRPKLMVEEVMPNGPMDLKFGLKAGDRVLEIGALDVNMNITSFDDATAAFHDAYARGGNLVVMRGDDKLTLPTREHVARVAALEKQAALAATNANGTPAPPLTQAEDDRGTVSKLLDAVRGTPGQ